MKSEKDEYIEKMSASQLRAELYGLIERLLEKNAKITRFEQFFDGLRDLLNVAERD